MTLLSGRTDPESILAKLLNLIDSKSVMTPDSESLTGDI